VGEVGVTKEVGGDRKIYSVVWKGKIFISSVKEILRRIPRKALACDAHNLCDCVLSPPTGVNGARLSNLISWK
jgi:hypothetical protein